MIKTLTAGALALALCGCATVKYADGERVAVEHESVNWPQVQEAADAACKASGGKAPATLVSNIPVTTIFPAGLVRNTATFRCS